MDESSQILRELAELRAAVRELTVRVFALEQQSARSLSKPADAAPAAADPPRPQAVWQPLSAPLPPRLAGPPTASAAIPQKPPRPAAVPRPPERDLESRIGSQWLNRIGITAL